MGQTHFFDHSPVSFFPPFGPGFFFTFFSPQCIKSGQTKNPNPQSETGVPTSSPPTTPPVTLQPPSQGYPSVPSRGFRARFVLSGSFTPLPEPPKGIRGLFRPRVL